MIMSSHDGEQRVRYDRKSFLTRVGLAAGALAVSGGGGALTHPAQAARSATVATSPTTIARPRYATFRRPYRHARAYQLGSRLKTILARPLRLMATLKLARDMASMARVRT